MPYAPARYVSIFDADIAQLVGGQSAFTVTMQPANQPPSAVTLSSRLIDENQPAGTLVGELGAVDADGSGETFTYRFCGGTGDGAFQITGDQLLSAQKLDYERQKSYSVCLEADDGRGGLVDQTMTIGVNDLPDTTTLALPAMGGNDGWVRESAKGSSIGGSWNATNTSLLVGVDGSGRRYRSVLAFNTSSLPAGAIVTQLILKVKRQGLVGQPFSLLGKLMVDAGQPLIGSAAALQSADYQAGVGVPGAGVVSPQMDSGGWTSVNLSGKAYSLVGGSGVLELKLRFSLTASSATSVSLYSGNAMAANRPVLLVQYELP